MAKRPSRLYQHRIVEVGLEPEKLNIFADDRGIGALLESSEFSDEIIALRAELYKEVAKLFIRLTAHQKEILKMRLKGLTQTEIGEQLGITQSAVHKSVHGNIDYNTPNPDGGFKRYGGAVKKLRRIAENTPAIQRILTRIEEQKEKEKREEE